MKSIPSDVDISHCGLAVTVVLRDSRLQLVEQFKLLSERPITLGGYHRPACSHEGSSVTLKLLPAYTTHEAGLGYEWVAINRFNHKQNFETLL